MASSVDYSKSYYKWSAITHHWYNFGDENNVWQTIHNHLCSFLTGSGHTPLLKAVCFDDTSHIVLRHQEYSTLKHQLEENIRLTLPRIRVTELSATNPKTEPVRVNNITELKAIIRKLNQQNDVTRREQQKVAQRYERTVKDFLRSHPAGTFLVIDVEMYEHDHSIVTEIGFVVFRNKQEDKAEYHHYIVRENLGYVNKDRVSDNRHGFRFGTSKTVPLEEAKGALKEQLQHAIAVVGHNIKEDAEALEGISFGDKFLIDTQELALAQASKPMPMSLPHVLRNYEVPCDEKNLHNAGNDCYYTMKAFAVLTQHF